MNIEPSSWLLALVSLGAPDLWLHGNPQTSIFKQLHLRTTNSQFTFRSTAFVKSDDTFTATIPYESDLIGQCYLSIKTKHKPDQIVKQIAICINNYTIETLTGTTLEIVGAKPEYELLDDQSYHIMIPVPFFFTSSTNVYFPMVSATLSNIKVKCTLVDATQAQIIYQAVYLDTE